MDFNLTLFLFKIVNKRNNCLKVRKIIQVGKALAISVCLLIYFLFILIYLKILVVGFV